MANFSFSLRLYFLLCVTFFIFNGLSLALVAPALPEIVTLPDNEIVTLPGFENAANLPDFQNADLPDSKNANLSNSKNVNLPDSQKANLLGSENANLPDSKNANLPDSKNINLPGSQNANLLGSQNANLPDSKNTNLPNSKNTNLLNSKNTNLPDSQNANLIGSENANLPDSKNTNLPDSKNANLLVSANVNLPDNKQRSDEKLIKPLSSAANAQKDVLPNIQAVLPLKKTETKPGSDPDPDALAATELNDMENNMTQYVQASVQKQWDYNTNINDDTENAMNEASVTFSKMYRSWWDTLISGHSLEGLSPYHKRQFEMEQSINTAILNEDDLKNLNNHLNEMMKDYGAKVCDWDDKKCDEDDEGYDIDALELKMATEDDYSKLLYYWEKWRDASGKEMLDDFKDYVELMNKAAQENGFSDAGKMWIEPYTTYEEVGYNSKDFQNDIDRLWAEIQPLYRKLYFYVRYRLKQNDDYEKYFDDSDLIPAHILGNMWAQSWENIYDQVTPYEEVSLLDISDTLEQRNNVKEMFETAEDFFVSIGMFNMTKDFWDNSMMTQPNDREVVCHASAWDFYSTGANNVQDGKYRIKMCTNTNQEDFIVIHHEMGHVEYYMSYATNTPIIYRDGANPGFHEAIGDTIALSVSTPSYLQFINDKLKGVSSSKKNQVKDDDDTYKQNINYLMKQALAKVAFLPYAYILDSWRWGVFNGSIKPDVYNKKWWEMRIDYQGVRPPISRSPKTDFDIGCKYHVPANVPYIRYFVAYILQFQFYEQLCKITEKDQPDLFNCNFYGEKDAGDALSAMLSKGASVHWQEQLKDFLGSDNGNMSSSSLTNYFKPLSDFLDKEISSKHINTDWPYSDDIIDDYMNDMEQISSAVPITVGIVLAVLVCIVLVAFFFGQRKRKREDMEKAKKAEAELEKGQVNNGIELEEKKDVGNGKNSEEKKESNGIDLDEKKEVANGIDLEEKKEELGQDTLKKEEFETIDETREESLSNEEVKENKSESEEQSDQTSLKDNKTIEKDSEDSKI